MTEETTEISSKKHWITQQISEPALIGHLHPLLASVFLFGTPANMFLLIISFLRWGEISQQFLISTGLGILWLNFSGYLIWYYDKRIMPEFFDRAPEIFTDRSQLKEIYKDACRLFSRPHLIAQITWSLLLIALFFTSENYLISNGLFEPGSILKWLYLGAVVYLGSMTAIGFMGVITTLYVFRQLADLQLQLDPLHPDGLGGLSSVGYYAIRTTVTFTTGSMLLPLAFAFIRGNVPAWLVYLVVIAFISAIAASFVYPTYLINRRAQDVRKEELEKLREKYQAARRNATEYSNLEDSEPNEELVNRLELERIRREYQDIASMRLYPFQVDIVASLISSIILPIIFFAVDLYII